MKLYLFRKLSPPPRPPPPFLAAEVSLFTGVTQGISSELVHSPCLWLSMTFWCLANIWERWRKKTSFNCCFHSWCLSCSWRSSNSHIAASRARKHSYHIYYNVLPMYITNKRNIIPQSRRVQYVWFSRGCQNGSTLHTVFCTLIWIQLDETYSTMLVVCKGRSTWRRKRPDSDKRIEIDSRLLDNFPNLET